MFEKGDIVKVVNIKDKFKGNIGEINYVMTDAISMYIVDLLGEQDGIVTQYVGIDSDFELVCKVKDRQDKKESIINIIVDRVKDMLHDNYYDIRKCKIDVNDCVNTCNNKITKSKTITLVVRGYDE